jgi:hypothetical protein
MLSFKLFLASVIGFANSCNSDGFHLGSKFSQDQSSTEDLDLVSTGDLVATEEFRSYVLVVS